MAPTKLRQSDHDLAETSHNQFVQVKGPDERSIGINFLSYEQEVYICANGTKKLVRITEVKSISCEIVETVSEWADKISGLTLNDELIYDLIANLKRDCRLSSVSIDDCVEQSMHPQALA